jgi:hypothetical protein
MVPNESYPTEGIAVEIGADIIGALIIGVETVETGYDPAEP